jgi:hypothetical protein
MMPRYSGDLIVIFSDLLKVIMGRKRCFKMVWWDERPAVLQVPRLRNFGARIDMSKTWDTSASPLNGTHFRYLIVFGLSSISSNFYLFLFNRSSVALLDEPIFCTFDDLRSLADPPICIRSIVLFLGIKPAGVFANRNGDDLTPCWP